MRRITRRSSTTRPHRRWLAVAGALALCASPVVLSGCMTDQAGAGYLGALDASSPDATAKADYEATMTQMRTALASDKSTPLPTAIKTANKAGLLAAQQSFAQALQVAESAKAPSDIAQPQAQLIAAMKQLNAANARITAAAPNVHRVKSLATASQKGPASKEFGAAVKAIEAKGYHVLTPPDATATALDPSSASDPLSDGSDAAPRIRTASSAARSVRLEISGQGGRLNSGDRHVTQ